MDTGKELHDFAKALFPICRSITGDGIRKTLCAIGERIPLRIVEVPTGIQVFDWTVPKEWNIRDAYIKDSAGNRVIDFQKNNLHVLNYSVPVHSKMSLEELKPRIFTLPEQPDWIPYKTSYYKETWGFCASQNQVMSMRDQQYEVCIDSTLEPGHLSYGECFLPGETEDEILVSCHACHPSLANDNLSGVTVATFLASQLVHTKNRYSYRFLFIPGTIGAITWLAQNRDSAIKIRHGLVLTCVGDRGSFHYKKSRRENSEIDRAAAYVLSQRNPEGTILPFSPYGYDERQYCSPGFDLPVGCLMRSVWGKFPEYHTSADNLEFLSPQSLAESLSVCASIFDLLEKNRKFRNLAPFCEPQLGRRGLYPSTGGSSPDLEINARLWVLNLSDGSNSLLDICERSGLPFAAIAEAADLLALSGLLEASS